MMPGPCAYTPYGYTRTGKGQIGFNGEFRDPFCGFYQLGNGYRIYSPTLGRFYSPDNLSPLGRGGFNAYAYCKGDPVNRVDRDGHSPVRVLEAMVLTFRRIVTEGQVPLEKFPKIRQRVHEEVDTSTKHGEGIFHLNYRLGRHGDNNLPDWKGDNYIKRTQRNRASSDRALSETSLFLAAVPEWYRVAKQAYASGSSEQLGAALIAMGANFLGAFFVVPFVHNPYKLGTILRKPGDQVPDIRK